MHRNRRKKIEIFFCNHVSLKVGSVFLFSKCFIKRVKVEYFAPIFFMTQKQADTPNLFFMVSNCVNHVEKSRRNKYRREHMKTMRNQGRKVEYKATQRRIWQHSTRVFREAAERGTITLGILYLVLFFPPCSILEAGRR